MYIMVNFLQGRAVCLRISTGINTSLLLITIQKKGGHEAEQCTPTSCPDAVFGQGQALHRYAQALSQAPSLPVQTQGLASCSNVLHHINRMEIWNIH